MAKILIVDDEPNIVEVIRLYLQYSNYEPIILYNGREVIQTIMRETPDLIILDIMLPDINGFDLCQKIRDLEPPFSQTPIICLTAKGESADKLRGFNFGADDYLVKPFDPNELIVRMRAILRRVQAMSHDTTIAPQSQTGNLAADAKKILEFKGLSIDLNQYVVTVFGKMVELTPKEIELLFFLASHPKRVYTREDLLTHVWNFDFLGGTRTVDAHVKNLRKKLGTNSEWSIQTLWGIGYAFKVTGHA